MTTAEIIKKEFPILQQKVNGFPLVYLDNAATTQKPISVINKIKDYYDGYNSNIHRGAHFLADKATQEYENARTTIAQFINAQNHEVNFTKGTTESLNLIATSYGLTHLKKDDEILVSVMEHHSNIVPWQNVAAITGAKVKFLPINQKGEIDMDEFHNLLTEKVKIVSLAFISNALGSIHPITEIIDLAHQANAVVVLDCAQAIAHKPIDVKAMDVDFIAFSGHKMFAPTGIGIMYGKEEHLEKMQPYQFGGEMIKEVKTTGTTYNNLPFKFEAGTPNICGGIALGEAVNFINKIGFDFIQQQEEEILDYTTLKLMQIEGLEIKGTSAFKTAVVSFLLDKIHPYDVGVLLDKMGIAIRTGHHCCQPLMDFWNIEGTARASFSIYNTLEDVDKLAVAIIKAQKMLS